MDTENNRIDLKEYYRNSKICLLCRREYGLDTFQDNGICIKCSRKKTK